MIKHLLQLSILAFALSSASLNGTVVRGNISLTNGTPVVHSLVMLYHNHHPKNDRFGNFQDYTYTDSLGNYNFSVSLAYGDSVGVASFDCSYNRLVQYVGYAGASIPEIKYDTIKPSCLPYACQTFLKSKFINSGRHLEIHAISVLDTSKVSGVIPAPHWYFSDGTTYNNIYTVTKNVYDSTLVSLEYCFSPYSVCNSYVCDSINIRYSSNLTNCNAKWIPDTVNSISYNGFVVIWNYAYANGTQTLIEWDFGDGDTSHQLYPTHIYSDTGIYDLCQKIITISGQDTCISVYCSRIGMDSNGQLIYNKTGSEGFTLYVVDPASLSSVASMSNENIDFLVYPNPAQHSININWDEDIELIKLELFALDGRLIFAEQITTTQNQASLNIENIVIGTYLVKAYTSSGVLAQKVLIKD